jgi:hypothetical protein
VSLNLTRLSFGIQQFNMVSEAQGVMLTNSGSADLICQCQAQSDDHLVLLPPECHPEHIRCTQCKLREGLARWAQRCFAAPSMTGLDATAALTLGELYKKGTASAKQSEGGTVINKIAVPPFVTSATLVIASLH